MVSASEDRKVIVWEFTPSSFLIRHRLTGHKDIATCASFDPTGTRIISGSNDNLIIIWDVETVCCLFQNLSQGGRILVEVVLVESIFILTYLHRVEVSNFLFGWKKSCFWFRGWGYQVVEH
uniref:Uncharacterized protein n=1 Tax=Arcella intermedia TaxID=1963864 RepID=A0A6B2LNS6_9EUKA